MMTAGMGAYGDAAWGVPLSPTAGKPLWRTQTYRRFVYALLLMSGLVAVFMLFGSVESVVTGRARVIGLPFSLATHCAGLAHFVIGFLFLVSSPGMRSTAARLRIVAAALAGIGLCALYFWAGGYHAYPRLPNALVFAYFLLHEFRDEGFFYRQYHEAPALPGAGHRPALLAGIGLALVAVAWSYPFLRDGETRDLSWLVDPRQLGGSAFALAWLGPVVVFAFGSAACFTRARRRSGLSLRRLFVLDRPLWAVYASIPLVWMLSRPFGGRAHSIVLLHVAVWWVFASVGLARHGSRAGCRELGVFAWVRRTQTGFQTLHVGLMLLVLGTVFLWGYGFGNAEDSPLVWIAKGENFYYWTILHVTISLVPRPSRAAATA